MLGLGVSVPKISVLDLLLGGAAFSWPAQTTWSATDAAANGFTLSGANNVVQKFTSGDGSAWHAIRTSDIRSSGLLFIEFQSTLGPTDSNTIFGFGDNGNAFSGNYVLCATNGGGNLTAGFFTAGAGTLPTGTLGLGTVIGWAINFTTGKVWISQDGTFINGGNPTSGTGPQATFPPGSPLSAVFYALDANMAGAWKVCATSISFSHAPPSGFSAWDQSVFFRNVSSIPAVTNIIAPGGFPWNTFVSNAFAVDPADAISGVTFGYTENSVDSSTYGSISQWNSTGGILGPWNSDPANPVIPATPGGWDNSYLTSPWPITIGGVKRIYYSARNSGGLITIGQVKWNGSAWVKSGSPIFPSSSGLGDPCVLGPFGSTYVMFCANAYPGGNQIFFYTSTDGDNWVFGGVAFGPPVSGDWDFTGMSGWFEFYPFLNRYGFLEAFYICIDTSGGQHSGYCISPNYLTPFKKLNTEVFIPFPAGAGNYTMRENGSSLYIFGDMFTDIHDLTKGGVGVTSLPI